MVKILSSSQKNNLTRSELLAYEKKLRAEVNRRASRFDKEDRFFKEKAFAHNAFIGRNPRGKDTIAPARFSKLSTEDLKQATLNLEIIIKSPSSTKKGRKEKANRSWETFRAGHPGWTRTRYNKFVKAMGRPEIRSGMQGMIIEYMLSEQYGEAYRTGFSESDLANAIIVIGESNLREIGIKQVTGNMVLRVIEGEDANEVLESVRRLRDYEESNE